QITQGIQHSRGSRTLRGALGPVDERPTLDWRITNDAASGLALGAADAGFGTTHTGFRSRHATGGTDFGQLRSDRLAETPGRDEQQDIEADRTHLLREPVAGGLELA